jgi:hypothetical protein
MYLCEICGQPALGRVRISPTQHVWSCPEHLRQIVPKSRKELEADPQKKDEEKCER